MTSEQNQIGLHNKSHYKDYYMLKEMNNTKYRFKYTELHILNLLFFQIIFIKVCSSVTFETPCIFTNRTSHYVVAFVSFAIDTNIFSATNLI